MAEDHDACCAQPFEKSELRVLDKLRFHVFVCADGGDFCGCEAAGSGALVVALRQEVLRRRLTAYCKITLMQCRQQGAAGPVLVVYPDGTWYQGLTADVAAEFVERQILKGEPLTPYVMRAAPRSVTGVPPHIAVTA